MAKKIDFNKDLDSMLFSAAQPESNQEVIKRLISTPTPQTEETLDTFSSAVVPEQKDVASAERAVIPQQPRVERVRTAVSREKKDRRTFFVLWPSVYEKLRIEASETGNTVNNLVNQILKEHTDKR